MATATKTSPGSTELLLLGSKSSIENVNFSVTRLFTLLSAMANYVTENIKTTETFILFVSDDVIKDLINDPIYSFPQVRVIYVYCDNYSYVKSENNGIQDVLRKLRFFHKQHLKTKIENVMGVDASSSSTSMDRTERNDVVSSHEQRISAKRSKPSSCHSSEPKRLAITSKHGFVVKNIEQIESCYMCRSCELMLREPHQLNCGHRICQSCIKIENKETTCPTCFEISPTENIWFDRGFHNQMNQLPLWCSLCDWTGSLESYPSHMNQTHSDNGYTAVSSDGNTQQAEKIMVPEQMYICEIIQQILSNIAHFPYSKNDGRSDLLSEIQDKIAIVSNNLNKLKNDQKRLRDRLSRSQSSLQVLAQNLSSCEISFEEHSSLINGLKINESLYRQEVWSLKKKIEEQRLTSFDGTLIWKIPCLDEKIGDARSERQKSIYSPVFYSSPTGYKMRLRLYLNGDDDVRGTHLSLFFMIMRGDYDSILSWPFSYKIKFYLLDQSTVNGNRCDITDYVWSDITSSCFQRPVCDMNEAYGIKRFLSLEEFKRNRNRYVQDGAIFVKAVVDFFSKRPESSATSGTGELPNDEEHVDTINENFMHIS